MTDQKLKIIEIEWDGPIEYSQTKGLKESTDFGLYQIYGTHPIFGADSLLYIGKASEQYISTRLGQHENWLFREPSKIELYIGRLGSTMQPDNEQSWTKEIDLAERLLIYNCAPPYNTQFLTDYGQIEGVVIVTNYGKRHRLPFEVSSLSRDGKYWTDKSWTKYIYKK
jgi:hypothetical protein